MQSKLTVWTVFRKYMYLKKINKKNPKTTTKHTPKKEKIIKTNKNSPEKNMPKNKNKKKPTPNPKPKLIKNSI